MAEVIVVDPEFIFNYHKGMYNPIVVIVNISIFEPLNFLIFVSSASGLSLRAKNRSESPNNPNFLLISTYSRLIIKKYIKIEVINSSLFITKLLDFSDKLCTELSFR